MKQEGRAPYWSMAATLSDSMEDYSSMDVR